MKKQAIGSRKTNAKTILSRQSRSAKSFVSERQEAEEPEEVDSNEDSLMLNALKELRKVHAKKAAARSAAFQSEKNAIYKEARELGEELIRRGTAYIEEARAKLDDLISQEAPFEKEFKEYTSLFNDHDESFQSLLMAYPAFMNDLFPRRAEKINAASATLESNPIKRERSRKRLLKNAKAHLDQGLEQERLATDATALIRHYKALLLS